MRHQLGINAGLWRVIGTLEIAGAAALGIGLALPLLGVVAAAGLSLLMVGAIAAHARVGDLRHSPPPGLLLAVAAATIVVRFVSA
jgi:hypothetical protein